MNWNNFLNRIRVSGMKTLLLTFALVVLLILALVLRTFSSQGDVDPNQVISDINRSLSRGDGNAIERLLKDDEDWQETSAKGLTELEARLQALNLERTRLHVVDSSTDRLRDQMDITLALEAPDLSLLGKYWQQGATDEESLLKNYRQALDELPKSEQRDVHVLLSDILGHSDSHPTLDNSQEFTSALTRSFREALPDLRAQLSVYEARLAQDSEAAAAPDEAANDADSADIQGPQVDDGKDQEEASPDAETGEDAVKLAKSNRREKTKIATEAPTTAPATPTTKPPTQAPSTEAPAATPDAPEAPVTEAPTQAPEPTPQWQAAPRIGETYTILDMNEDLVSIARQAYSDYANPEDYVYLIIEANNLPLDNGQIVLYYGQTIYLPVPAQ